MAPDASGEISQNMTVDMGNGNKLEVKITFKPKEQPKEEEKLPEEIKMEEPKSQIEEEE